MHHLENHPDWIWQHSGWPRLRYDAQTIVPHLQACVQGIAPLAELAASLEMEQRLDWEAAVLLDETLATAHIEGEEPEAPLLGEFVCGDYRDGPMSIQSGRYGRHKTHFIAPRDKRQKVTAEMELFLNWLNHSPADYIRAALAKFHFVTIPSTTATAV